MPNLKWSKSLRSDHLFFRGGGGGGGGGRRLLWSWNLFLRTLEPDFLFFACFFSQNYAYQNKTKKFII